MQIMTIINADDNNDFVEVFYNFLSQSYMIPVGSDYNSTYLYRIIPHTSVDTSRRILINTLKINQHNLHYSDECGPRHEEWMDDAPLSSSPGVTVVRVQRVVSPPSTPKKAITTANVVAPGAPKKEKQPQLSIQEQFFRQLAKKMWNTSNVINLETYYRDFQYAKLRLYANEDSLYSKMLRYFREFARHRAVAEIADNMDRRDLLLKMFTKQNLVWSEDAFELYKDWVSNSETKFKNRYFKMCAFIVENEWLFSKAHAPTSGKALAPTSGKALTPTSGKALAPTSGKAQ
jgi:hypothetical protein